MARGDGVTKHPQPEHADTDAPDLRDARRLGTDPSSWLRGNIAPSLRAAHSPCFHVGQPVGLGGAGRDAPAVLRVAIGAPLVLHVASDPSRLTDRIQWLDAQLGVLSAKLDALLDERVVRAAEEAQS